MFTVCSKESQFTVTAIGIQLIFRNTVGTVLARIAFTRRLKILNKENISHNIQLFRTCIVKKADKIVPIGCYDARYISIKRFSQTEESVNLNNYVFHLPIGCNDGR